MMKSGGSLLRFVWWGILVSLLNPVQVQAQPSKKGPPPALVTTATVSQGEVTPQAEFIGTVYYPEVAQVAAEVEGIVEEVTFEAGKRVKQGTALVRLGSDLLLKRLEATQLSREQVLSDLENAETDLARIEKLYRGKSVSAQSYDEKRFRVKGLEKRSLALMAQVERLEIELRKKVIRSPFSGVVLQRHADRGEWLSSGDSVAVIAKDDRVDIVAEVPQRLVRFIRPGMAVKVTANDRSIKGTVFAMIPKGDIATRTFPVKIRTANKLALFEGMEARVILPAGKKVNTMLVHRDAVIRVFGRQVVYTVKEGKAVMIPVRVTGYDGLQAGVAAEGLAAGDPVVIKGNERIRNGQPLTVMK